MNHNQEKIKNASRKITILLKVVLFASVLSTLLALAGIGSHSDTLLNGYTTEAFKWKPDLTGLLTGMILYCISLIFRYGCDLQRESDETL